MRRFPVPTISCARVAVLVALVIFVSAAYAQTFKARNPGFVYVAAGSVFGFTIDVTTGALTPVPGSPFNSGYSSGGVAADPTGRFLYVASFALSSQNSSSISAYTIDETTGSLTSVPGSPFPAELYPSALAVDLTGRFLYAVGPTDISAYKIEKQTGALTSFARTPFSAGSPINTSVAVDPAGPFIYVTAATSDAAGRSRVFGYRIHENSGALEPIAGSPFLTEHFPFSIVVDPTGMFVYVTCGARAPGLYTDATISAYTIDPETGALTQVSNSPYVVGFPPLSVTVDPFGRFVYVANTLGYGIDAYTVDRTTGALTQMRWFFDSGGPRSVAVDPTGHFLYAADQFGQRVSAYTIDQNTGDLTLLSVSGYPVGTEAFSITTTTAPE